MVCIRKTRHKKAKVQSCLNLTPSLTDTSIERELSNSFVVQWLQWRKFHCAFKGSQWNEELPISLIWLSKLFITVVVLLSSSVLWGKCLREITLIRKHAKIAQIAKSFTWYTATGPNQFGTNGKEPKPRVGQSILPQDYESPEAKWNQLWWLKVKLAFTTAKFPRRKSLWMEMLKYRETLEIGTLNNEKKARKRKCNFLLKSSIQRSTKKGAVANLILISKFV